MFGPFCFWGWVAQPIWRHNGYLNLKLLERMQDSMGSWFLHLLRKLLIRNLLPIAKISQGMWEEWSDCVHPPDAGSPTDPVSQPPRQTTSQRKGVWASAPEALKTFQTRVQIPQRPPKISLQCLIKEALNALGKSQQRVSASTRIAAVSGVK